MSKLQIASMDQWINDVAAKMVQETLKILDAQQRSIGPVYTLDLSMNFLTSYIASLVYRSLTVNPGPMYSNKEVHALVEKSFAEAKMRMQDAVSSGFQGAWLTYTGKSMEYYCTIKPVPEPPNKKPC